MNHQINKQSAIASFREVRPLSRFAGARPAFLPGPDFLFFSPLRPRDPMRRAACRASPNLHFLTNVWFLYQGQRVQVTLANGAEYEGIYANNQPDSPSFALIMVQQRKPPRDIANGTGKREQPKMSFQTLDVTDCRVLNGNPNKVDGKTQNGRLRETLEVGNDHPFGC